METEHSLHMSDTLQRSAEGGRIILTFHLRTMSACANHQKRREGAVVDGCLLSRSRLRGPHGPALTADGKWSVSDASANSFFVSCRRLEDGRRWLSIGLECRGKWELLNLCLAR
uniref:Uncharacterized protein n=1 Tax=Knipowitschia caucasica TaxID=637954 RepID=A0AAV2KEH5_KNICA